MRVRLQAASLGCSYWGSRSQFCELWLTALVSLPSPSPPTSKQNTPCLYGTSAGPAAVPGLCFLKAWATDFTELYSHHVTSPPRKRKLARKALSSGPLQIVQQIPISLTFFYLIFYFCWVVVLRLSRLETLGTCLSSIPGHQGSPWPGSLR